MDQRETFILLLKNGLGWSQEEIDDEGSRNGVLVCFDEGSDYHKMRNDWLEPMAAESEKDNYPYRLVMSNNDGRCSDFALVHKEGAVSIAGRRSFDNLGEYIDHALREGLISLTGDYLLLIKVGSSSDPEKLLAHKLAYPNQGGYLFCSQEAAENYMEVCVEHEPDIKRSGGFIARRV